MCHESPLNSQNENGPTSDHAIPRVRVTINNVRSASEPVRTPPDLGSLREPTIFASFQAISTTSPHPAMRWASMK